MVEDGALSLTGDGSGDRETGKLVIHLLERRLAMDMGIEAQRYRSILWLEHQPNEPMRKQGLVPTHQIALSKRADFCLE